MIEKKYTEKPESTEMSNAEIHRHFKELGE